TLFRSKGGFMKMSNNTQMMVTPKKPITSRSDHFLRSAFHCGCFFLLVFFFVDDLLIAIASLVRYAKLENFINILSPCQIISFPLFLRFIKKSEDQWQKRRNRHL